MARSNTARQGADLATAHGAPVLLKSTAGLSTPILCLLARRAALQPTFAFD